MVPVGPRPRQASVEPLKSTPCSPQCKVPIGTPSSKHYDGSCTNSPDSRPPGYPYWQVCVGSGNRFEYGGDGGTPEIGLAALEHFYYRCGAERVLPLSALTLHRSRAPLGHILQPGRCSACKAPAPGDARSHVLRRALSSHLRRAGVHLPHGCP
jgi:hypothetical protein